MIYLDILALGFCHFNLTAEHVADPLEEGHEYLVVVIAMKSISTPTIS